VLALLNDFEDWGVDAWPDSAGVVVAIISETWIRIDNGNLDAIAARFVNYQPWECGVCDGRLGAILVVVDWMDRVRNPPAKEILSGWR